MSDLNAVLVTVGGLVLGLGLVSGFIHSRLPLSTPLLALLAGVAIGPAGFDLLDPDTWGPREVVLGEVARLTLAIGLMATALRLPPRYFFDQWRIQALLIGVLRNGLVLMNVSSFIQQIVIGVILTSRQRGESEGAGKKLATSILYGLVSALGFGIFFVALGAQRVCYYLHLIQVAHMATYY